MERQARFCMVLLLLCFVSYAMGRQLEQSMIKTVLNEDQSCTYLILTQTSDKKNASTDAEVGITLCSPWYGCFLNVTDISKYGILGPDYPYYFNRAVYGRFRLPSSNWCAPICKIVITLNGTETDSWIVDTVEVQSLNDYEARKYYTFFPIYGKIESQKTVTADHCALQLDDGKTIDVAALGFTRIFTSSSSSSSIAGQEIIA